LAQAYGLRKVKMVFIKNYTYPEIPRRR